MTERERWRILDIKVEVYDLKNEWEYFSNRGRLIDIEVEKRSIGHDCGSNSLQADLSKSYSLYSRKVTLNISD